MTEVDKTGANPQEGTENIEELKQKIAQLEQEKTGLVDEIKEDRNKRQGLQQEIDLLKESVTSATAKNAEANPDDVKTIAVQAVQEVLNSDKASRAKENKSRAFEKFIIEHKEFNSENDPTGKKREALQNKFNSFRDDGFTEVNEFYSLIADASKLLGVDTTPKTSVESEVPNPYTSTPLTHVTPSIVDTKGISDLDKQLMEQNGWSEEKFLGLKQKNPTFVQSLYKYVQN